MSLKSPQVCSAVKVYTDSKRTDSGYTSWRLTLHSTAYRHEVGCELTKQSPTCRDPVPHFRATEPLPDYRPANAALRRRSPTSPDAHHREDLSGGRRLTFDTPTRESALCKRSRAPSATSTALLLHGLFILMSTRFAGSGDSQALLCAQSDRHTGWLPSFQHFPQRLPVTHHVSFKLPTLPAKTAPHPVRAPAAEETAYRVEPSRCFGHKPNSLCLCCSCRSVISEPPCRTRAQGRSKAVDPKRLAPFLFSAPRRTAYLGRINGGGGLRLADVPQCCPTTCGQHLAANNLQIVLLRGLR